MRQSTAFRKPLTRGLIWLGTLSSGLVLGGGCNADVRSVVLSGLNELTVALIDAFFVSLDTSDTTASLDTTKTYVTPWCG
jgi:hypothetical protein